MECQRIETQIIMQVGRLIGKKLARGKKIKKKLLEKRTNYPNRKLETFQINLLNLRNLNAKLTTTYK
jgi:hypothetical protein